MSYLIAGISDGGHDVFDFALYLLLALFVLVPLLWCVILFWIGGLIATRLERKRSEEECAGQDLPS